MRWSSGAGAKKAHNFRHALLNAEGDDLLQVASVTLTDAQIKALPTTPVEIVAAPGAGKFIAVVYAVLVIDTMAAAYTNIDAEAAWLALQVDGRSITNRYDELDQGALASTAQAVIILSPLELNNNGSLNASWPGDVSDLANQPLVAFFNNGGSGAFTGGDDDNSLKVVVYYVEVEL